jgi:hypothetical protein
MRCKKKKMDGEEKKSCDESSNSIYYGMDYFTARGNSSGTVTNFGMESVATIIPNGKADQKRNNKVLYKV